jgi:hypothetical protein
MGRFFLQKKGPFFTSTKFILIQVRGNGVLRSTHADEVREEVLKALEETEG